MQDIEDEVRRARRTRLVARGGAADYQDAELYAAADRVLRRAIESRNHDALLLPEILSADDEWELATHLRFSSHRPVLGPIIVFVKRRVLLPLTRWLFEYNLENFKRQQHVNRVLFACIEELAIENARLRGERGQVGREGQEGREGLEGN